MYLTLASKARIVVQAIGHATFILDDSFFLEFKDCLYVLESRKNLISVSSLCKLNYSMVFYNKHVFINLNDSFICFGLLINNLYCVTSLSNLLSNENYHNSLKRKKPIINFFF